MKYVDDNLHRRKRGPRWLQVAKTLAGALLLQIASWRSRVRWPQPLAAAAGGALQERSIAPARPEGRPPSKKPSTVAMVVAGAAVLAVGVLAVRKRPVLWQVVHRAAMLRALRALASRPASKRPVAH